MSHLFFLAGLIISLALFGCSSAEAPLEVPSLGTDPFSCNAADELNLDSVTDFESGTALGFYTNDDGTVGATVEPPAGASSPPSERMSSGRCGISEYAFHMTSEGLTGWGLVFGKNFDGAPVDFSNFDGVSFWARRGEDSGETLFFSVTDTNTDPVGGRCVGESDELSRKCDAYGLGIGLATAWRFYQVPFDSLQQRGFGVVTKDFDAESIVGLSWAAGPGDWDIWVDDVSFYRADDPAGAAGSSGIGGDLGAAGAGGNE